MKKQKTILTDINEPSRIEVFGGEFVGVVVNSNDGFTVGPTYKFEIVHGEACMITAYQCEDCKNKRNEPMK